MSCYPPFWSLLWVFIILHFPIVTVSVFLLNKNLKTTLQILFFNFLLFLCLVPFSIAACPHFNIKQTNLKKSILDSLLPQNPRPIFAILFRNSSGGIPPLLCEPFGNFQNHNSLSLSLQFRLAFSWVIRIRSNVVQFLFSFIHWSSSYRQKSK